MSEFRRAHSVAPKRVEWLWRERIPKGMLSVVAGKPDQGKGLFSAHVAADVSRKGGNVLYSAVEDDAGMMTRPRLEAAGANLKRIWLWRFRLPEQMNELAAYVDEHDIDLVVLDPFAAHLRGVSRHSDNVREVTTPLSKLAERTGCAFLITEHALKRVTSKAHPLTAIGGTGSGLPAAARMAFIFGVDPDDAERRILANVKANIRDCPKPVAFETDSDEYDIVGEVPSLVYQGETEYDARRLLTSNGDDATIGRKPEKRAAAAEWITEYLYAADDEVLAGDVLEDAIQYGFTKKTMRRAAREQNIVKNPPGGGRNCKWSLPDELRQMLDAQRKLDQQKAGE